MEAKRLINGSFLFNKNNNNNSIMITFVHILTCMILCTRQTINNVNA